MTGLGYKKILIMATGYALINQRIAFLCNLQRSCCTMGHKIWLSQTEIAILQARTRGLGRLS